MEQHRARQGLDRPPWECMLTAARAQLGAIQRLDLALLIHEQHHRALGRVEVQPADVFDLVHEQRIGGQLERLRVLGARPQLGVRERSLVRDHVADVLTCEALDAPWEPQPPIARILSSTRASTRSRLAGGRRLLGPCRSRPTGTLGCRMALPHPGLNGGSPGVPTSWNPSGSATWAARSAVSARVALSALSARLALWAAAAVVAARGGHRAER